MNDSIYQPVQAAYDAMVKAEKLAARASANHAKQQELGRHDISAKQTRRMYNAAENLRRREFAKHDTRRAYDYARRVYEQQVLAQPVLQDRTINCATCGKEVIQTRAIGAEWMEPYCYNHYGVKR